MWVQQLLPYPLCELQIQMYFLSTDFWCCLPECFFQLCGELAYLMVFCLPLPLSSGVLLDFVCYIIDLTLLTPITMFYCLKFLSVSEDTTLTCSSWRFVCRSKSLFDIVPVFFGFSLIISLRGSLRAEKRSPNSNWKSVFFTLFAVVCYHGGVESVCILIENIILLFASLEVEQCIFLNYESFKIAPNLLSIKWSNMVFDSNCKSLFFFIFHDCISWFAYGYVVI